MSESVVVPASSQVVVARRISAKYKLQILRELDAVTERGGVGRILRREGLYSSLISKWRQQRDEGALDGLKGVPSGRRSDASKGELARLREENARLQRFRGERPHVPAPPAGASGPRAEAEAAGEGAHAAPGSVNRRREA